MNSDTSLNLRTSTLLALIINAGVLSLSAQDTNLEQEVRVLREENAALQKQLDKQNQTLDSLSKKVEQLETANSDKNDSSAAENSTAKKSSFNIGNVNLSGEGGLAFFDTGTEGFAPHSEFRVDEARLFIEAPIWKEVYFYSDVDLATRENTDLRLYLNELYLDFQDISQLWGQDGQFNVRAGRLNIPFGEEYQHRNVIDNPLISRSLPDIWGVDPGIEIYGAFGKVSYVVAVQNGGVSGVKDFSSDKSVAARIGYDPNHWLHFSVSGMRTGNENLPGDGLSSIWFGNTFFQSLGSAATTQFHANLVEGDMTARWKSGHTSAFVGYAHYDDNDPFANNGRGIYYYSIEGVQNLPKKFFTSARFSEIFAPKGIPIMGLGNGGYFSSDWTTTLWRLSLGLGYRFSDSLILKTEYSFERGKEVNGDSRNHEDFFGTEAAFKF